MAPGRFQSSDFVTMSVLWCAFAALGIAAGMFANGRREELDQSGTQVGALTQEEFAELACKPTVVRKSEYLPELAQADRVPTRLTSLRGDAGEIRYLLKTPEFGGGEDTRLRLFTFVFERSDGGWCAETLEIDDQLKSPEVQASE